MIAAGVIVTYQDSVLLAKRAVTYKGQPVPFGGYWSIFTGAVDATDPSVAHTAQRELEEETEIIAPLDEIVYVKTIQNPFCTLNIYGYQAPTLVTPKLDYEHTEHGWFSIPPLDFFPEKIDPKVLECIKLWNEMPKK